jgi:uncharacterized protein
MTLEMRSTCERCGSSLTPDGEARICSFECTFCLPCADVMEGRCPNCGGELVTRPRRRDDDRAPDPRFEPGWAEPLDAGWLSALGEYFASRDDVARAYAVTAKYLAGISQEELMIELVDPPEIAAPNELFREVSGGIPMHPIADAAPSGAIARVGFTFTPQRLVDEVRANGELVWKRDP